MELKKTLAAAAVAATCASFNANAVIQIDTTGLGNIAGAEVIAGINWDPGNLVLDQGAGATNNNARLLGHSSSVVNGINFTYQFDIPIVSTRLADGQFDRDISTAGTGTFKLFMDPTPVHSQSAGTGYGTLNGAVGGGGDQVELLSGDAFISLGGFSMSNTLPDGSKSTPFWLSENNTVGSIATMAISGSLSINIDVLTQAAGFVVNDMVNTSFTFDMNAITLGPLSPFDPQIPASAVVVDSGALDYGAAESAVFAGNPVQQADGGGDHPTQPGVAGVPVNDFNCAGGGLGATCDAQFQTSGNTTFRGAQIPEPGTLAMLGLGLSLFGASRRRRAKV